MNYLKIGICEDDPAELKQLLKLLEDDPVDCETECYESGEDFIRNFHSGKYDLIFMDIYMKEMSGVETVAFIREQDNNVPIAFLTTSTEHALDGYRFHVDRYLVKPYKNEDLREVLELAVNRLSERPSITVLTGGKRLPLVLSHICYIEQAGRVCEIHMICGDIMKTVMKLAELTEMLPCPPFLPCHKSFVVNLNQVQGIDRELNVFNMKNGEKAYIRRGSLKAAENAYQEYMFSITRNDPPAFS